ncbi:MAG: 5'-methylthioadenosine/S-adenosylhomocysteine nucleosidase [Acidobacteriaceae bacterium]|nr:5'-methylthioadenosine/S-adenosylhomocysteine nucleosidase [Acidobacteriaceae bacterium]
MQYIAPWSGSSARTNQWKRGNADVGVITILSEEINAVNEILKRGSDYRKQFSASGRRFYEATIGAGTGAMRVVATQARDPGQGTAIVAFQQLCDYCAPSIVVLCGIAGGIDAAVNLGDVVIAREVIYYDLRKEVSNEVHHRGKSQQVPAIVQHAVNDMFGEFGEPMIIESVNPEGVLVRFKALSGAIGTGEAVIACSESQIRNFLKNYNYKTLAVETEAGGVAEAFYEQAAGDSSVRGWVAIRGISDHADDTKDDTYHMIASRNAAAVLERLLPYLKVTG